MDIEFGCYPNRIKQDYILWLVAYTALKVKLFVPETDYEWKLRKRDLQTLNPMVTIPYIRISKLRPPVNLLLEDLVVARNQATANAVVALTNNPDFVHLTGCNLSHKILIKSLQSENEQLMAFALNLVRRTPEALKVHYDDDISARVIPTLSRIQSYYKKTAQGKNREWEQDQMHIIDLVNPEKKLFLTGLLPTVADFELAYLSDHFAWICKKDNIPNPFESFKDLK